jgi:regulator of RNase E activity RraA
MSLTGNHEGAPAEKHDSDAVPPEVLQAIRLFDTPAIANAIERFHVRLRNRGFTRPGLRCVTGHFPKIAGYAATFRIRSSDPPMAGESYFDRTDWWNEIRRLPLPRIAVMQDLGPEAGLGSLVGEVHAAVLKAFGCEGVITDGAVRDVPAVSQMDFGMFAKAIAVSHAYTHIVDFGSPVEILGLEVSWGDLLFADCHGVVSIPREIACDVAAAAALQRAKDQRIIDICRSPDFSEGKLLDAIRQQG